MTIERKVFQSEIKAYDDDALIIEHFISTATQDDGGDIMEPDGMVVRGKPVVLFQHGLDPVKGMEPIAKPISFTIGVNEKGVKGIIARTQYYDGSKLEPPDNTGRRLYEKAKGNFMPNWSIGFDIDEYAPTTNGGRHVKRWRLMEYSQVAVGMNEEAVADVKQYPLVKYKVCDSCKSCGTCKDTAPEYEKDPEEVTVVAQPGAAVAKEAALPEVMEKEKPITKSLGDRLAITLPINALAAIFDAAVTEVLTQAYTLNEKTPDAVANDVMSEFIDLAMPHMVKLVEDCRREPDQKEKFANELKKIFGASTPAVPSEAKVDPATPPPTQEPIVEPPESILSIKDEPTLVIKEEMVSLPFDSVEEFKKSLTAVLTEVTESAVNKELRRLQGKLD
jgi:hypothetical protein